MAVPNTFLLDKWAVADWDGWNSLAENIQNSAVLIHTKNSYRARKVKNFKETVSSFSFKSFQLFKSKHFHIFYISALPAGH